MHIIQSVLVAILYSQYSQYFYSFSIEMGPRTFLWFRNNLRVHDNCLFNEGYKTNANIICIYCFDPRHFMVTRWGSKKTNVFRARFLLESVTNLKLNLKKMGGDLLIVYGIPEIIIPSLAKCPQDIVIVQKEVTSEEMGVENKVESALKEKFVRLLKVSDSTLYHESDLPYKPDLSDFPNSFTTFKDTVEKHCRVRPQMVSLFNCTSNLLKLSLDDREDEEVWALQTIPSLMQLGFSETEIRDADGRGVCSFQGGEEAGRLRCQQWMFEGDFLKDYFELRNGMIGSEYSSKLSPWLALGCLSPRYVFEQVINYASEHSKLNNDTNTNTNISTTTTTTSDIASTGTAAVKRGSRISRRDGCQWFIFHLIVRDFYRFLCSKFGVSIFLEYGALGIPRGNWSTNQEAVTRWKTGTTGMPLVDANMRELQLTGWMSNRGRQNVASYLVHDLMIDWRIGADHFESYLIDHDVSSNYGNWNAAATLTGGRVNRFNITKQSKDYDPQGAYMRHWLPELAPLPVPLIFEPWKLSPEEQSRYGVTLGTDYPRPMDISTDRISDSII